MSLIRLGPPLRRALLQADSSAFQADNGAPLQPETVARAQRLRLGATPR